MPPVSNRQRRAMYAALEGHSKLGIPQNVAREFLKNDDQPAPEGGDLTDFETAEAIRYDELPSPTKYGDFWLFDLRITGTGAAYRDKLGEWGIRDASEWTSPEFVQRCNGLMVIFEHPPDSGLNTQEFRDRAIGSIILPYVKSTPRGDEVWGIAKVFDADAAELMQTTHRSTSPGVTPPKGSEPITLENGAKVLDEGLPLVLDHLAVCEQGVWDKDGPPEGIRLDSLARKDETVTEAEREKLEKERDDAMKERDDMKARLDASEKELEEIRDKHRKDDGDDHKRDDKKRKDEDEEKAIEKAEEEKHVQKGDDKKRKDAKMDDDDDDDDDDKKGRKDDDDDDDGRKDRGRRKDGAPVETVNANEETLPDSRKDSARIRALETQLAALSRQPTIEERNEIAKAYHRADSVYQMLGERAPLSLSGESPIAYRRRLCDGLRKHLPEESKWRKYVIKDSVDALDAHAFELIEEQIYNDAIAEAKKPPKPGEIGTLRMVERTENGKVYREFIGDSRVWMQPFMPATRAFLSKINTQTDLARR